LAARVKPESFRQNWQNNAASYRNRFNNVLVMTEIVPFSFDTYRFQKSGGGLIEHAPEAYVRILPPNQSPDSSPPQPSPVSLAEKNLEDFVVQQLHKIEPGLCLVERQPHTPAGRLDLLCQDALGNYVVVELKKTKGTDQVIGQILRYMGWVTEAYPQTNVRGIVIVGKKDDALLYALKAIPNVEAKEFSVNIV
jgi:restriction system protein